MKRYQILMERYRLSPARYEELRRMCHPPRSREVDEMIHTALSKTNPDVLGRFILDYVTRPGFTVAKLQQRGLPCHPRTFAVHKAHFSTSWTRSRRMWATPRTMWATPRRYNRGIIER